MAKVNRSPLVQKMLDDIKQHARYRQDVPKEWMCDDFGMEKALLDYVTELEKRPLRRRSQKPTKR